MNGNKSIHTNPPAVVKRTIKVKKGMKTPRMNENEKRANLVLNDFNNLKRFTLYEKMPSHHAQILTSPSIDPVHRLQYRTLCEHVARSENNTYAVEYTRNGDKKNGYYGRATPRVVTRDSEVTYKQTPLCVTTMWREIRATLFKDKEIDVDIVNCHPSLLVNLVNLVGKQPGPYLSSYINNRKWFIENIQFSDSTISKYNEKNMSTWTNKDAVKNLMTRLLFNGSYKAFCEDLDVDPDTVHKYAGIIGTLEEDIKKAYSDIMSYPVFNDFAKRVKKDMKRRGKTLRHDGQIMAQILGTIEFNIINTAMHYFKTNHPEYTPRSCIYDGFQVEPQTNEPYPESVKNVSEILNKIQTHIHEKYGLSVEFITKPFSNGLSDYDTTPVEKIEFETTADIPELSEEEELLYDYKNITTDETISRLFYLKYGRNFIFHNDMFYHFNGTYWQRDPYRKHIRIALSVDFVNNVIKSHIKKIESIMNAIEDDEDSYNSYMKRVENSYMKRVEMMNKCITRIHTEHAVKGILTNFTKWVCTDENHQWERNPNLVVFKNGVWNMRTREFTKKGNPEDYMHMCTGYDYEERNEDDVNYLYEIIRQILPEKDVREFYLTLLSTGLIGETLEKFIISNGSGGNGKGLLHELFASTLGDYGYTGNNAVLLNPIGEGANAGIASMSYKRFIVYREPDSKQSICTNTVKEITGGSEINARMLYSNDCKTILHGTHVLECNEKLRFDGRIDNAIIRRLHDVAFSSTFTQDNTQWNEEDRIYPANAYLKTQEFKQKYRLTLFHILAERYYEFMEQYKTITNLKTPKSVQDATKEYLTSSDQFHSWFYENYKFSDEKTPGMFVTVKEIFEDYKVSDMWELMSKAQKRKNSLKYVTETIKNSYYLRKHFKERYDYKDDTGKRHEPRRVLVQCVKKYESGEDYDEEED